MYCKVVHNHEHILTSCSSVCPQTVYFLLKVCQDHKQNIYEQECLQGVGSQERGKYFLPALRSLLPLCSQVWGQTNLDAQED